MGRPSSARNAGLVAVAVLVVVGLVAAVVLLGGGNDEETAGGEIFLEPAAASGPDPFTDDVAAPPPSTPVATTVPPVVSGGAVQQVSGGEPGLYGGTRDQRSCDVPKLQQFLAANPDKAAAWASVVGVPPEGIPGYLATLTPVLLRADTRVTNHGFRNGRATPRQAVLQAGTAVLVDRQGVPRVKCACGNPLAPPRVVRAPQVRGPRWDGFDIEIVIVVAAAPDPLPELIVADISTGDPFVRPTGVDAGPDRPVDDSTTTTTAPTTTTTAAPTTTVPPSGDITGVGEVSASSEYSGEFPASLAVDGDVSTSWFSAGPEDGQTTYLWRSPGDVTIDSITIVGNAAHPDFPTGFGFGNVEVRVVDGAGEILFAQEVGLGGTPDPDVTVNPNVTGRNVVLVFRGHEAPDCGGFSELRITGR